MMRVRGFTLFEFAVCMALTALLAGGLLSRLGYYRAQCDRVAAQQLVAAVRTALAVRAARLMAERGEEALAGLAHENPVAWLSRPPGNYLGEYHSPQRDRLKPGHWYYDRADKSFNFLLRNDTFTSQTSKLLKFKVELSREPVPTRSGGRREAASGVVFDQVQDRTASNNH